MEYPYIFKLNMPEYRSDVSQVLESLSFTFNISSYVQFKVVNYMYYEYRKPE